jgi:hypothetical protein
LLFRGVADVLEPLIEALLALGDAYTTGQRVTPADKALFAAWNNAVLSRNADRDMVKTFLKGACVLCILRTRHSPASDSASRATTRRTQPVVL